MDKQSGNAAEVLGQLSLSLNRMLELLHTMVSTIRPPSANTLPSVTATLSGIAEATESAASRVLDEAEAIQGDQLKLNAALERLRGKLPSKDTEAAAVWAEAAACSNALSARALKIMSAMEFQDLTSQHIGRTLHSIEEVRERLGNVLSLFDIDISATEPVPEEPPSPIGPAGPFDTNHSGQALADQLLAEHK